MAMARNRLESRGTEAEWLLGGCERGWWCGFRSRPRPGLQVVPWVWPRARARARAISGLWRLVLIIVESHPLRKAVEEFGEGDVAIAVEVELAKPGLEEFPLRRVGCGAGAERCGEERLFELVRVNRPAPVIVHIMKGFFDEPEAFLYGLEVGIVRVNLEEVSDCYADEEFPKVDRLGSVQVGEVEEAANLGFREGLVPADVVHRSEEPVERDLLVLPVPAIFVAHVSAEGFVQASERRPDDGELESKHVNHAAMGGLAHELGSAPAAWRPVHVAALALALAAVPGISTCARFSASQAAPSSVAHRLLSTPSLKGTPLTPPSLLLLLVMHPVAFSLQRSLGRNPRGERRCRRAESGRRIGAGSTP